MRDAVLARGACAIEWGQMTDIDERSMPWVRVIVVNYNGGALIQPCIDALARQSFRAFEAVIVDNASEDGSADALRLPDRRFSLIRNRANLGFAAANNCGARACGAPWIATLNPDTVAEPDWLEQMYKGALRYPDARMLGATLVDAGNPALADGFGDVLSIAGIPWRAGKGRALASLPQGDVEVFSPCAAAAIYDRRCFERAGGFDETFFCYVEDVDLGFRLRLSGERCIQLREAVVRHRGSAITGRMSDFTLFHSYRNRLWLLLKNMPPALILVAVPLNLLCSAILLVRLARSRKPVGASLRGLLAGLTTPAIFESRRKVQRARVISTAAVARSLVWDLSQLRHQPVIPARELGVAGRRASD
jgi:GT2 family glycosyltransferase